MTLTIQARLLSAPGTQALHVVELSGSEAAEYLAETFWVGRTRRKAREYWTNLKRAVYGEWRAESWNDDGYVLPTPDRRGLAFWCTIHGNPYLAEALLKSVVSWSQDRNLRLPKSEGGLVVWPASTRIEVEVYEQLPWVDSEFAAQLLLGQLEEHGLLGWASRNLNQPLDQSEVDILIARSAWGRCLCEPPRVVILGPPNAGKSTLFNRLVGESRVVTDPVAGTTRDVIEEPCRIGDLTVRLVDGAGVRETVDPIERIGVERIARAARDADLVIELRSVLDPAPGARSSEEREGSRVIRVLAQIDRHSSLEVDDDAGSLAISARTGVGLEALKERVVADLVDGVERPEEGPVPFTERQRRALLSLRESLLRGESGRDDLETLIGRQSGRACPE